MSNLATASTVQRLHPVLLCHCGETAVMAYGFPGVSEQAVCATHEHGLVLRRELEPGRALVATVRRFDTVPGPVVPLAEIASSAAFEKDSEVQYFRDRVAALGVEVSNLTEENTVLRRFLDESGLPDPTLPTTNRPPGEESSRVE